MVSSTRPEKEKGNSFDEQMVLPFAATLLRSPLMFAGGTEGDETERFVFGRGAEVEVGEAKREGLLGLVTLEELEDGAVETGDGEGAGGGGGGGSEAGSKLRETNESQKRTKRSTRQRLRTNARLTRI